LSFFKGDACTDVLEPRHQLLRFKSFAQDIHLRGEMRGSSPKRIAFGADPVLDERPFSSKNFSDFHSATLSPVPYGGNRYALD